uniref:Uncharacterized protein n=1 Tax=Candidatus Kentrum sp. DK TaxID=2126562 RepID=A0A450SUT0_9GAMM|nr:MAG: hypothetical protein BECKDK2373B_GA0170837_106817 [Candidatus Kentron sp. DK]
MGCYSVTLSAYPVATIAGHPEATGVDADILDWFRKASDDWEVRMQTALRLYVESHKI